MLVHVISHSLICIEAGKNNLQTLPVELGVNQPIWYLNRFPPITNTARLKP